VAIVAKAARRFRCAVEAVLSVEQEESTGTRGVNVMQEVTLRSHPLASTRATAPCPTRAPPAPRSRSRSKGTSLRSLRGEDCKNSMTVCTCAPLPSGLLTSTMRVPQAQNFSGKWPINLRNSSPSLLRLLATKGGAGREEGRQV
jgi:hypothetical protein